jgi:hypothetical protein
VASASAAAKPQPRTVAPVAEVEPIDLLGSAGPAIAKRLIPLVIPLVLVLLFVLRRRRH